MSIEDGKAKMQHYARGRLGSKTTVSILRMYKHSSGWKLVIQ
ncbi:hypothetical protein [Pseudomonas aeruginosa]|nr:hypothetical protein [Pseudomonas aeruginosa]